MDLINKENLKALGEQNNGPCVSIYMPTHRAGPETRQDPIRLKNLADEAERRLIEGGQRAPEARDLLRPARELVDNYDFWQRQSDGLVVFVSPQFGQIYRLPADFEELLVVSDRFHIKPLLPIISGDGQFYVLALSQNEIRLLRGTHYSVGEVELTDVPQSLAEALWADEEQRQLQFHTQTQNQAVEGRRAIFHGHGIVEDDKKEEILRFFQQVDAGLQEILKDEKSPLVLAGVEYLLPIYEEANNYRYLVEHGVEGNPEQLSAKELHERAWKVVEPIFKQAQDEAIAQYHQFSDSDRASKDVRTIVPAAYYGRVDVLFVAVGQQQWGAFDPNTDTVELYQEPKPQSEDLLDSATLQTLEHGGTVYAMDPENVPDSVPLAATFRWQR